MIDRIFDFVDGLLMRPGGRDGLSSEKILALLRIGIMIAIGVGLLPATFDVDQAVEHGADAAEAIEQAAPHIVSAWNAALALIYLILGGVAKIRERHRQK